MSGINQRVLVAATILAAKSPTSRSTSAVDAESLANLSSCRTIAEPTITPSAKPRSVATCSGLLTPKPTASGRVVLPRSRLSWPESSSGSWSRAPVVPAIEMQYTKPLPV